MYHHVSPCPGLVTVSPGTFVRQMEYVRRAGYTALNTDRFLAFLKGRETVPAKSVLITFDDGYLDNYVHAFPVLEKLGLHAVIFVVTGWVGDGPVRPSAAEGDNRSLPPTPNHRDCKAAIRFGRADEVMLRWSEIETMEASGAVEIHSHTHRHVRWDQEHLEVEKRLAVVKKDLSESRDILQKRLGKRSEHLCWPWGYFEPAYQEVAREVGFAVQYTIFKGVNMAGSDPARVPRVVVKDRPGFWFATRLWIYRHSFAGRLYARLLRN